MHSDLSQRTIHDRYHIYNTTLWLERDQNHKSRRPTRANTDLSNPPKRRQRYTIGRIRDKPGQLITRYGKMRKRQTDSDSSQLYTLISHRGRKHHGDKYRWTGSQPTQHTQRHRRDYSIRQAQQRHIKTAYGSRGAAHNTDIYYYGTRRPGVATERKGTSAPRRCAGHP